MTYECFKVNVADYIATVVYDRPPVNAQNRRSREELIQIFDECSDRDDVRVVVLTGAGRVFSAGADIKERVGMVKAPGDYIRHNRVTREYFYAVADCAKPVIAAVNGPAIGAGFYLMMSCDIMIAADHAYFQMREVDVGLSGGMKFLSKHFSRSVARYIYYTGRKIPATELYRVGVLSACVPAAQLMDTAMDIAREIASKSPLAILKAKAGFNVVEEMSERDAYRYEQTITVDLAKSEDTREAQRAFIEKRKPVFKGALKEPAMAKPFEGIRILDFSQVVSGPYGTEQLALLGADVIKFERPPIGDEARTFCTSKDLLARGLGSSFLSLNAGKRSMSLDLKKPAAIELVKRLIPSAHVIVENFRPGAMARMGLSYEDVLKIKPDIVYCSITGYGQKGPDANSPAYDGAIQAASGVMSITGEPDGRPLRVGFPFSDAAAGAATALAIAASLYRRLVTGKGQYIDLAMVDATLSMMSQVVGFWLIGGTVPGRLGNMAWSRRPTSDMFKTGDDYLMLVVNTEPQFLTFCNAIGRPDLPADPRFTDWPSRSKNIDELRAEIENALAARGSVEWELHLKEAGVTASRVKTIADALQSEQMANRNLVLTLHGTAGIDGPIRVLNAPFLCNEDGPGTDCPPPGIGEHNGEILHELGLTEDDIAQLRLTGVLF